MPSFRSFFSHKLSHKYAAAPLEDELIITVMETQRDFPIPITRQRFSIRTSDDLSRALATIKLCYERDRYYFSISGKLSGQNIPRKEFESTYSLTRFCDSLRACDDGYWPVIGPRI